MTRDFFSSFGQARLANRRKGFLFLRGRSAFRPRGVLGYRLYSLGDLQDGVNIGFTVVVRPDDLSFPLSRKILFPPVGLQIISDTDDRALFARKPFLKAFGVQRIRLIAGGKKLRHPESTRIRTPDFQRVHPLVTDNLEEVSQFLVGPLSPPLCQPFHHVGRQVQDGLPRGSDNYTGGFPARR